MTEDKRPDPKPRKHPGLWLAYVWYDESVRMRTRWSNRGCSIERGKSSMSAAVYDTILAQLTPDAAIKEARKLMIKQGRQVGTIWDWLVSIKGISEDKAAQLLAHIDDIEKFALISKLRRFAGLAVFDGKAEIGTEHYNRKLKALLLGDTLIVDQFIRHHTPVYRDHYDKQKARYYEQYPDPLCNACGTIAVLKKGSWICPEGCKVAKGFKVSYTPLHIDKMARRKVAGLFISHLWLKWREFEGLPVTVPWILRDGTGHTTFIEPPS
jgi:hypothetical protein